MTQATTLRFSEQISWEILPDDFVLPDDPVDNINQPSLAAALTDALVTYGKLGEQALFTTNYGICAKLNDKFVVKAPDWAYIPQISVSRETIIRSYTPKLQGDLPAIVMEFLSDTDGHEYSVKPTYPPGKWFFYAKILQVPNYIIFDPFQGTLEYYRLDSLGNYELQTANQTGKYWIEEIQLYLGVWQGTRELRQGYWLRWWTAEEALLLWGTELAQQERQRAEKLAAFLQDKGFNLDDI